jgi:hypothetical protein
MLLRYYQLTCLDFTTAGYPEREKFAERQRSSSSPKATI